MKYMTTRQKVITIILLTLLAAIFATALIASSIRAKQMEGLPAYEASRVVDEADVFSEKEVLNLSQALASLQHADSIDGAVAAVSSLEGEDIEVYAQRLISHWRLGGINTNGGALIVLAPTEGKACVVFSGNLGRWLTESGTATPTAEACGQLIRDLGYGEGAQQIVEQATALAVAYLVAQ